MNGRTRTLLAIAMSSALLAPMAFAQKAQTETKATVDSTQATRPTTTATPTTTPKPTSTTKHEAEATVADLEQKKTGKTGPVEQKPTTHPADAVDARVVPMTKLPVQTGKATEDPKAANQDLPPTSQGAAHAAAHSSVVQRDVWARLDADGDGKISAIEADVDTRLDGDFAAMDRDADGFVTNAEYSTFAKADTGQGAASAASHSSVVQRDTWSQLDTDGDGRISAPEADADAGIDGSFAAMDSNGDGFITDVEFRAHAKATGKP
jgi:hypothetical protein